MTEPTIRAVDAEGRTHEIPRARWISEMLPPALAEAEREPDRLAALIAFALQQGAATAVVDAAKRLARTDSDRVRGRNLFGAALAAAERFDEAEVEIENLLLFAGEEPTALVNLAQLKLRKGDATAATDLLRRALAADPNHAGAFDFAVQNGRRRSGEAGVLAACRALAADARAWRARIALARARLALGDGDAATALYREAAAAGADAADALTQISGDLLGAGLFAEALELVGPRYRAARHGPHVAANLARLHARLGRRDEATRLVAEGRAAFGPAWTAAFDALERELAETPGVGGAS